MAREQHLYRGGSEADFESPDWWSRQKSTEIDSDHSDSDHRNSDSDSGDEWGLGDYNDEDDGWDIVSFPSHVVWMCCVLIAHLRACRQ